MIHKDELERDDQSCGLFCETVGAILIILLGALIVNTFIKVFSSTAQGASVYDGKWALSLVIEPSPGVTVAGEHFEGWGPRIYETMDECFERKEYAERQGFPIKGYEDKTYWSCDPVPEADS